MTPRSISSRRSLLALAGLSATMVVLTACASPPSPPPTQARPPTEPEKPPEPPPPPAAPWRVGALFDLTGARSSIGLSSKEGMTVAVEQINAHGGVRRRPFEVSYIDIQLGKEAVIRNVKTGGHIGFLADIPYYVPRETKLTAPLLSTFATSTGVSRFGPNVFHACIVDERQAEAAAIHAVRGLGRKRIAILFSDDGGASRPLGQWFRAQAEKLGAQIVATRALPKGSKDVGAPLAMLKRASPDLVYVALPVSMLGDVVREAGALGISSRDILGASFTPFPLSAKASEIGPDLEGIALTDHWAPDAPWPRARAFTAAYRERFMRDPEPPAATAYDALHLLADALDRAGSDAPEALHAALRATKGFGGATGEIAIDTERDADKEILIVRVRNGKAVFEASVKVTDPPESAPRIDP